MPLYHTIRNQRSTVGHNASDARQTYEGNLSARSAPDSAGYIRFSRTKSSVYRLLSRTVYHARRKTILKHSNREESTIRTSKKRFSLDGVFGHPLEARVTNDNLSAVKVI